MVQYVFYDDTDCGGIVYHARYLVFCERARSLLFFQNNMSPQNGQYGFVVQNIQSQFVKPLQFGDMYEVKTTLLERKSASLTLSQEIYKIGTYATKQDSPTLSFCMQVKLAHIDLETKKPCKIAFENIAKLFGEV